jgi:cobalt-precorrin-5B (C1)-methyltransferase
MRLLPDLPEVAFVEVGDFTGAALRRAVEQGVRDIVFVGMVGKLTKLASGVLMTHYTRSGIDTTLLGRITAGHGGSAPDVSEVEGAATARRAYEIWESAGILRDCGDDLCERVRAVLTRFSGEHGTALPARVAMVNFAADRVVASTEPQWVGSADPPDPVDPDVEAAQ